MLIFTIAIPLLVLQSASAKHLTHPHGMMHHPGKKISAQNLCEHRPNTVLQHCVSGYNECLPSCMEPEPDSDRCFRTMDCVSRCLCRDGFISEWPNGGGRCIRREECEEKLCDDDPLTVPNKCIDLRKCLPTCENPEPDRAFCDYDQQECSKQPLPRCVCRPGFVSQSDSGDGPCIKLEDCPKRRRVLPMPEPDGPPDVPLPLPPPSKETEE